MSGPATSPACAPAPGRPRWSRSTASMKRFPITRGVIFQKQIAAVHAVEDVSFSIAPGETVGLVGESGCGKSTTPGSSLRLLEPTAGTIRFEGRDISLLTRRAMRPLRREIQMVFQDPYGRSTRARASARSSRRPAGSTTSARGSPRGGARPDRAAWGSTRSTTTATRTSSRAASASASAWRARSP